MDPMNRRIALPLAALVVLTACAPSTTRRQAPLADTVVVGVTSDLQSWNPYLAEDANDEAILSLVYPSLAVEQPDYQQHPPSFKPSLAQSWEFSDDGLDLTFHLRPDAVWNDGTPVTSADLLFSFQVQTSEELGWGWGDITDSVAGVEALDAHTVRYRFTRRYPYQLMDVNDGPIVPAHAWSGIPLDTWEDTDWSELVVSAGPFQPGSHSAQQEIILERNPLFFEPGRPKIERLVFRVVPSSTQLLTQLLSGAVDLVNGITPADAARVQKAPEVDLTVFTDRSYTHVCWNLGRLVFADADVRRALALAVDRDALIEVVYDGYALPSVGPVLSSMWAFNRGLEPVPFDPDEARRLLAEAGWLDSNGDGILDRGGVDLAFELLAPSESDTRQDVALMIERDLGRIGVSVTPRFLEWGALQAAMTRGDFDAFVNRVVEPTQVDLWSVWHSTPPDEPTFNFGGYDNPEVDRLLEEVEEAPDFAAQKPLLDEIQTLIVADQPYLFLVENTRLVGHNTRIEGADINAASIFFNVGEWVIATGQ
jgi:peptide/nickel transport system substrate-binding protein